MAARPSTEDVRRAVDEEGVEFLFAQFVDMHAKPSAKLIPAVELDGLLVDGAGFAGFAAGDIGQTPDNPDLIAMPDVGSFTRLPASSSKIQGLPSPPRATITASAPERS